MTPALIAEHGLIGDLQTAALVSTNGEVDWFCSPRFDSPSIFGSLLDDEKGGYFRITPAEPGYVTKQLYVPDTAVLITRFMTDQGVGEVVDFMPVDEASVRRPTDRHRLIRVIRVVRGVMRFRTELQPRFDYGRARHTLDVSEHGAVFRSDGATLTAHVARTLEWENPERVPHRLGEGVRGEATVREGQIGAVILETGADVGTPHRLTRPEIQTLLRDTVNFWRRWADQSTYRGRWREQVQRSAVTLKLMTYAPSGAVVAAPTAGLPEQVGGERNWDYRFTWVRDASFSVYALLGLGYVEEAKQFVGWLSDRIQEQVGDASGPLKIMYRVDGSSDLVEDTLPHLAGYQGSTPVRIGNGAADQLQLDIYGEALDAIYFADRHGVGVPHQTWTRLVDMLDWLCEHWDEPEEGIWESRGGRKDYVYGRVNSWAAFDRAIRLATERGLPGNVTRWTTERDAVYREIMQRGWSDKRQAFVQHFDTDVLDASVLRMVQVGLVTPDDPMWRSTLDAMNDELVSDSLVYRYDPEVSPDGLSGGEGTFSLCTFWWVDALARSGRLNDAQLTFEKMHTYANHLGLYSEEIGLTGEQLGNFPQAFTHLSLINAALTLNDRLDRAEIGWVDDSRDG
ncbi:MAG: glycoside hydrolase family 15 protein [Frankia sp.]